MVHISHLSWSKKISSPEDFAQINEEIEVVVLDIDIENRKLSLGHKQLEDNPWDTFETIFTVDSTHKGTIVKKNEKGAIVMLSYGVEGFVSLKHIVKEDGSSVELDEAADFKVIEFNKETKKIILSHTNTWDLDKDAIPADKERLNKRKPKKSAGPEESKTTLGDLGVLDSLKEKMQQESDDENTSQDDEENSSDKDSK
ncbi:MAG: S1 RNA-binding domain-containing protein [Solitalea-like symbiont of Acarus siro]